MARTTINFLLNFLIKLLLIILLSYLIYIAYNINKWLTTDNSSCAQNTQSMSLEAELEFYLRYHGVNRLTIDGNMIYFYRDGQKLNARTEPALAAFRRVYGNNCKKIVS